MKKLIMCLAPFALVACDGPTEDIAEELDDVTEAQGEVIDEQAEALEAMAENPEAAAAMGAGLEGAQDMTAEELQQKAEALEDAADEI